MKRILPRPSRLALPFAPLATLVALPAHAGSLCDFYRSENPDLYKLVCQNSQASAKPAGANSTFASSFNLNSASLPTEPSSYGLETLVHRLRGEGDVAPTFSIVKGFHKFGTGISTGSNDTFYGDDIVHRLEGTPELRSFDPVEPEKGKLPNLNIGTSIALYSAKEGATYRLGLSARYNKVTNTWGGGPALLVNWKRITLGAGFTRERVSNFLPPVTFTTFQASARPFSFLEFQLDVLANNADPSLTPISIWTTTLTIKRVILTAAVRSVNYAGTATPITQGHFALQILFSKHLSAGFLVNYVPGANSVGLQYFL